jgi:hypothetical protein
MFPKMFNATADSQRDDATSEDEVNWENEDDHEDNTGLPKQSDYDYPG